MLCVFYHNLRKREDGRKREWGGEEERGGREEANELISAPHFWTPHPSFRPLRDLKEEENEASGNRLIFPDPEAHFY